ncbi:MAG: hypothetical protein QXS43_12000 [Metallosphaera sp.]|uniref:hypothetical protein n=1 Tax=Metallosphaera sp. TaxID=2020860 RepID=UPI00316E7C56
MQTTKVLQYVPYENNEKIAIISRGRVSKYFVMTNLTADDLKALFSDVWNTTTQDNKLGGGSR